MSYGNKHKFRNSKPPSLGPPWQKCRLQLTYHFIGRALAITCSYRFHFLTASDFFDSKPATQEDKVDHHQSQHMRWMIKKGACTYYACARTASVNMMQWHLQRKGREIIIKQTQKLHRATQNHKCYDTPQLSTKGEAKKKQINMHLCYWSTLATTKASHANMHWICII